MSQADPDGAPRPTDEELMVRCQTGDAQAFSDLYSRYRLPISRYAGRILGDGDAVVVTHGGVIYAIEGSFGESWQRLSNLGARWITIDGERLELGDRLVLVDPHDVTVTTPNQI